MNHDQLLSQIMQKRATVYEDDVAVNLADILYSIANYHEPDKDGDCSSCFVNVSFDAASVQYPCSTIDIMMKALPNA